jgi:hypothetical protein
VRLQNLPKWCAFAQGVLYTGLAMDAVVFKGRFKAVCRSFGLSHVLTHPSSRPLVVSETVRLEENSMCILLIQAAFINFPERLPVDMEPERPLDAWSSPVARALVDVAVPRRFAGGTLCKRWLQRVGQIYQPQARERGAVPRALIG